MLRASWRRFVTWTCVTLRLEEAASEEEKGHKDPGEGDSAAADDEPPTGLPGSLYELLTSRRAALAVALAHAANIVAMVLVYAGMPHGLRRVTRLINVAVTLLFGAEAAARCVALGPRRFSTQWGYLLEGSITLAALVRWRALGSNETSLPL
jgi:hypothetical protein